MGKWTGKACRMSTMISMTLTFFVVELAVGHITNSLALIADSFHMLSDIIALIVGLVSVRFARRGRSQINTYGWARAEVLGALINAVFLVALCFNILIDAVQRLVSPEAVNDATLLLVVGGIGLLLNLVGLCLFGGHAHGHSHGGSHSHGGEGHQQLRVRNSQTNPQNNHHAHSHSNSHRDSLSFNDVSADYPLAAEVKFDHENTDEPDVVMVDLMDEPSQSVKASAQQLNMRGVFLHVLGDALGSVVVMISAGITVVLRKFVYLCHVHHDIHEIHHDHHNTTQFIVGVHNTTQAIPYSTEQLDLSELDEQVCPDPKWVMCIDPVLSMVLVMIILSTSLPLLKQAAEILLQTVPQHIAASDMEENIEKMDSIVSVHELHIWSLSGRQVVASLHIVVNSLDNYLTLSKSLKHYFHINGIHSVTIQPEFDGMHDAAAAGRVCMLECGPDMDCHTSTCCHHASKCEKKAK